MRIISVSQNGKDWHAWRGTGLGASDAPVVMGASPWETPFGLWLNKTGLCPRPEPNEYQLAAMRRGHELEPHIRIMFEKSAGRKFEPVSAEHDEHAFIRASFDGYNAETNELLEIKAPNKVDHAKAAAGKVPDKYYPQLQAQFLVSGAVKGYYVSWSGVIGAPIAVVEVYPDPVYQARLLEALIDFWRRVEMKMAPAVEPGELEKLAARAAKLQEQAAQVMKALAIGLEAT